MGRKSWNPNTKCKEIIAMKKTILVMVGIICGMILGAVLVFNTFATEKEMDNVVIEYGYGVEPTCFEEDKCIVLVVNKLIEDGHRDIEIMSSDLVLEGLDLYYVRFVVNYENGCIIDRMLVSASCGIIRESNVSLFFYIF